MKNFQLDIITPTSIQSYENISYLRIPSLDGLTGIQAKHANAIIALDVGEIKITINGLSAFSAWSFDYENTTAIKTLYVDSTEAETSGDTIDLLSNGFRITDNHSPWNTSGRSYVYASFAEHPFKTARAS